MRTAAENSVSCRATSSRWLLAGLVCASAQVAAGTGIFVTTDADVIATDGLCSLREAIINANDNAQSGSIDCAAGTLDPSAVDSIYFDPGLAGATIALNGSALPSITQALNIVGPLPEDPAGLVLDGGGVSRILQVQGAAPSDFQVNLSGLTLRGGRTTASQAHGGAMLVQQADVEFGKVRILDSSTGGFQAFGGGLAVLEGQARLIDSEISGNVTEAASAAGGGIMALGTLQLIRSTVSGNRTRGNNARGGGLVGGGHTSLIASTVSGNVSEGDSAHGGGIAVAGNDLVLINSTVSGNRTQGAGADGGGVWVDGGSSILVHATLALNAAEAGGVAGLVNTLAGAGDEIVLHNALLAQSRDGELACSAAAATHTGTLATDAGCTGIATAFAELALTALGAHGGPTLTHALLPDSAAIGVGGDCPATLLIDSDQRGQPRPGTGSTSCDAGAYEFQPPLCATSSVELQGALGFAASNGIDDEIRIAVGHYPAPPGGFLYTTAIVGGDQHAIAISGGWTALGNDACGQLGSQNALDTVLDGGGSTRALSVETGDADVRIERLSFVDGVHAEAAGGLSVSVGGIDAFGGEVTIERNAFIGNQGGEGGGLSLFSSSFAGNARFVVSGNLFVDNHAIEDSGAASIGAQGPPPGDGAGLFLIGNTAIGNTTDATGESARGGIHFLAGPGIRRVVANNLLWGNQAADLLIAGATPYELLHNNIGTRAGFDPAVAAGNLDVAPLFEACIDCLDLLPALGSALLDAGYLPTPADGWSLPALDLRGRSRVAGGGVDIGAFENDTRLFADGFES